MRKILSALLFLIIGSLLPQLLTASEITHLRVKRLDQSFIDAYVAKPDRKVKLPLLIMSQGSGTDSQVEGFFKVSEPWADKAARLVVEKYGVKRGDKGDKIPPGYLEHNTIHGRLDDYLRVLQYLRKHADWWNGEVYVMGGSEGGLLSGLLASYYPDVKKAVIISYGGMHTMREAWPLAKAKLVSGGDSAMAAQIQRETLDSFKAIDKNPSPFELYDGDQNTKMWWASINDLRLGNALLDLDIPLLLLHGSNDQMMPVSSARGLANEFTKNHKTNLRYKEYEGMDHGFKDSEGKSHYKEVLQEAIAWLLD